MKISKAAFDALPAEFKSAFSPIAGTDQYDNGEEAVSGLKSALQKEKEEKGNLQAKLQGFEDAKMKEIEAARKKAVEEARTTGDFATVEKDYQRRIKELQDGIAKATQDAEARVKSDAVAAHVEDIAKMFVSPALAKSFIRERLTAEIVDGQPIVRVLDASGKASAASVEDLKKEYLTSKELKSSIVASKATGGGAGVAPVGGGAGIGKEEKPFDALGAQPSEMVARLDAKFGAESGE